MKQHQAVTQTPVRTAQTRSHGMDPVGEVPMQRVGPLFSSALASLAHTHSTNYALAGALEQLRGVQPEPANATGAGAPTSLTSCLQELTYAQQTTSKLLAEIQEYI